jgi:hypothetical protein
MPVQAPMNSNHSPEVSPDEPKQRTGKSDKNLEDDALAGNSENLRRIAELTR